MKRIKKIMNSQRKKKEYDKTYYLEHKEALLKKRKEKYSNDIEFKEMIKQKQKDRYQSTKIDLMTMS